jgi:glycosyltransferase involved in cell wall biosynthesis
MTDTKPTDTTPIRVTSRVPRVALPVTGVNGTKRPAAQTNPRVVIATILPPEGSTGVQTHVREAHSYLAAAGRDVTVVHPRSSGGALAPAVFAGRVPVAAVSREGGVAWYREWHWRFLRRALRGELRAGDDVVVYAQCPLAARAALDARTGPNQRVVMAVHFDGSQADEWVDKKLISDGGRVYRNIRTLERLTIPYVDGVVFLSASALHSLRRYGLCRDQSSWQLLPNFTTAPEPVAHLSEAADLVTLGGLEIHKNHQYLLQILAAAKGLGRRYTLDIIGDGPTRRGLARATRELGLEQQVRMHGCIPHGRTMLPGHRAYVHTATREVFPFALIEAMAAGLPIVAGCTGGIAEMLEHQAEGAFWPLDDAEAAARILVGLLDDEPRRSGLARAARARFERSYDARVVGPVLDDFLSGRRPVPVVERDAAAEPQP